MPAENPGESFLSWASRSMGTVGVLILLTAGVIFLGACVLMITHRRRPEVWAASLILLPLPMLLACIGMLQGMLASFQVIAHSPVAPTARDVADGFGVSLFPLWLALVLTLPSSLVLSIGLLASTIASQREQKSMDSSGT